MQALTRQLLELNKENIAVDIEDVKAHKIGLCPFCGLDTGLEKSIILWVVH